MYDNPHALRSGASVPDDAGGRASTGAQRLGLAESAAAESGHNGAPQDHLQDLTGIAKNAHTAAAAFTNVNDLNAKPMRGIIIAVPQ